MKILLALVVLLFITNESFADDQLTTYPPGRTIPTYELSRLADRVSYSIQRRGDYLSKREKEQLYITLRRAEQILRRGGSYPYPPRRPRPILKCIDDSPEAMARSFRTIKILAYSSPGFNMTEQEAKIYATNWINTYSCSYAEDFRKSAQSIRVFSQAEAGLDLTLNQSIAYSIEMTPRFCGDLDFRKEFSSLFSFAYSRSGLNLPREEARTYAREKVESNHFSCESGQEDL